MSKQSILIVDDNYTNIQVLNEVLHQSYIEKHGGDLTVESELGKGTSFTIKLKAHSKTT